MKKRLLTVLGLCLLCGLLLAGCGKKSSGGTGSGDRTDGTESAYNGNYYSLWSTGIDETFFFTLLDGRWELHAWGDFQSGTYTVEEGKISFRRTMSASNDVDQELMSMFGIADGQSVKLYAGTIEEGVLTVTEELGEPQDPPRAFYLDGKVK